VGWLVCDLSPWVAWYSKQIFMSDKGDAMVRRVIYVVSIIVAVTLFFSFLSRQTSLRNGQSSTKKARGANIVSVCRSAPSKKREGVALGSNVNGTRCAGDHIAASKDAVAGNDLGGNMEDRLTEQSLLSSLNRGKESERFLWHKTRFYKEIDQMQKDKGEKVLRMLRQAMPFPPNMHFQASYRKIGQSQVSYTVDSYYKAPALYREDATGGNTYQYITDGTFEVTNYGSGVVDRQSGVTGKDLDTQVFLESFPIRIAQDSDLVWIGERDVPAETQKSRKIKVDTLGSWFYDVDVQKDNSLVHEVRFYDRHNRSKQIVRISNITYNQYSVNSAQQKSGRAYTLPSSYEISFADSAQNQAYKVDLSYVSFKEQPRTAFKLEIKE